MTSDVRQTYLEAAAAAVDGFADPVLLEQWDEPSALADMTVGALVAHTARALSTVRRYLGGPAPERDPQLLDAPSYLLTVLPEGDDSVNEAVRERAADDARAGHEQVLRVATDDLASLRRTLPHLSAGHVLSVLDGAVMTLDEYLATRIVELVVHHDDILASVGEAPRRDMPDDAGAVAVAVLAEVARRRSSTQAMITALSRRERAGDGSPRAL